MKNMKKRIAKSYTEAERIELVQKTLSPLNKTVVELSKETGISENTISTWRKKYISDKNPMPVKILSGKGPSSREKFLIVMETYSMPEAQLSEYCRSRGLYVEDIKKWRESCMDANVQEHGNVKELKNELQEEKKKYKQLEKELGRKEKALAETAALLVLRKKLDAILGDPEEG